VGGSLIKIIKDPIHGYIKLSDEEVKIIDSKYFQRLRNIIQLSTTHMVYPSARHSRFEHSLGVFYLSKMIIDNLIENCNKFSETVNDIEILEEIRQTLRCASLLHDIGHFPYSHLGEVFCDVEELLTILDKEGFIPECEKNGVFLFDDETATISKKNQVKASLRGGSAPHELSSCALILSSDLKDIIEDDLKLNPFEVCAYILGESIEAKKRDCWHFKVGSQILNSKIDADKLDYIIRDHRMSGALLSGIDSDRMIMAYTVCNEELVLSMKALSIINNFLLARESIYMWVCQHHKVVFSNTLLKRMISLLPQEKLIELFSFKNILNCESDDNKVICTLKDFMKTENEKSALLNEYYKVYTDRNYYLKSCWKHIVDFLEIIDDEKKRMDISTDIKNNPNEVELFLKDKLNLKAYDIIVGISEVKRITSEDLHDIRIDYNGKAITAAKYDIYIHRENFVRSVPYVYIIKDKKEDCITLLKNYSKDERKKFSSIKKEK
jgi:uncharacterized protein